MTILLESFILIILLSLKEKSYVRLSLYNLYIEISYIYIYNLEIYNIFKILGKEEIPHMW